MNQKYKVFLIVPFFLASGLFAANPFTFNFSIFEWIFDLFNFEKDAGIFMSFNSGETWQQKVYVSKRSNIAGAEILTIEMDPSNSKIVYLGTKSDGLWKSMDGGEIWYQIRDANKKLSHRANIYDIAIDPNNTNIIYAGAYQQRYGRLFRSQDAGITWEELYITPRSAYAIFAVAVDPLHSSSVYMGTAEGILFKSNNYGESWRTIKSFNDVISDIKIYLNNSNIIYVSTFKRGVYKTVDRGQSWQSFEKGLKQFSGAAEVESLVLDFRNSDILYVGSKYGILKTIDGGQNWQRISLVTPIGLTPISGMAVNLSNHNEIYYGADSVVYKTIDGGKNWSLSTLPSGQKIRVMAIDNKSPNVLYIGMGK